MLNHRDDDLDSLEEDMNNKNHQFEVEEMATNDEIRPSNTLDRQLSEKLTLLTTEIPPPPQPNTNLSTSNNNLNSCNTSTTSVSSDGQTTNQNPSNIIIDKTSVESDVAAVAVAREEEEARETSSSKSPTPDQNYDEDNELYDKFDANESPKTSLSSSSSMAMTTTIKRTHLLNLIFELYDLNEDSSHNSGDNMTSSQGIFSRIFDDSNGF